MAGVYRQRHPERTVLYRVLFHYFERFLEEYEHRFEKEYGYLRPIVQEVVEKYLDCGNPSHNTDFRIKDQCTPPPAFSYFRGRNIKISFFGLEQFSQFLFGFRLLTPLRFIYKEKKAHWLPLASIFLFFSLSFFSLFSLWLFPFFLCLFSLFLLSLVLLPF